MAAEAASGSATVGGSSSASEIEKLMAELGLQEDDMDDVVVMRGLYRKMQQDGWR